MRVIAGRFRGRAIFAPKGLVTRPTTDRVREALFQILGPLDGMRAIDFYAGTGALGIEALSRRAAHSTFVETDRAALDSIRKNLERLEIAGDATVLPRDVERSRDALRKNGPYDLVLSDPPWKISADAGVVVARVIQGLLSPDARVVLGHPSRSPFELPPSLGLRLYDRRRWGDSGLSFFEIS